LFLKARLAVINKYPPPPAYVCVVLVQERNVRCINVTGTHRRNEVSWFGAVSIFRRKQMHSKSSEIHNESLIFILRVAFVLVRIFVFFFFKL
jgi:hypothetical protein